MAARQGTLEASMRKIFQTEWFGIRFADLPLTISEHEIAGVEFYSTFYEEFYRRFRSYSDLPDYWISGKEEIAQHLALLANGNNKVLSIGCGNGYIEKRLIELIGCNDIVAIEPGIIASQWVDTDKVELLHGLFPDVLDRKYSSDNFDFIYASGIDYVFDDATYRSFLSSVAEFGIDDFMLTEIFVAQQDIISNIKNFVKKLIGVIGLRKRGQFWGYLRTVKEHEVFLREAGFNSFESGRYKHGAYWIKARK